MRMPWTKPKSRAEAEAAVREAVEKLINERWENGYRALLETVPDGERVAEYNRGYQQAVMDLLPFMGPVEATGIGRIGVVEEIPGGYQRLGMVPVKQP